MKIDDSAFASAFMCFLISAIPCYFFFVHDIKISIIVGLVIGLIMYVIVANRKE